MSEHPENIRMDLATKPPAPIHFFGGDGGGGLLSRLGGGVGFTDPQYFFCGGGWGVWLISQSHFLGGGGGGGGGFSALDGGGLLPKPRSPRGFIPFPTWFDLGFDTGGLSIILLSLFRGRGHVALCRRIFFKTFFHDRR